MGHRGMVAGLLCVVLSATALPGTVAAQPTGEQAGEGSFEGEPAADGEREAASEHEAGGEPAEPATAGSNAAAEEDVRATQAAEPGQAAREPQAGEELVELRTETSKTFATDTPGTLTTRVYGDPVHFAVDEGVWEEIDEALVATGRGGWRNGANSFGLSLAGASGDGLLAELDLGEGRRIGFAMDGRPRQGVVDPRSQGTAVVYREVLPQVDVRLTSTATGLKEELVVRSAAAADTFAFPLRLEGVTAELDAATGEVVYRDAAGDVVAVVPRGWMEDSASGAEGVGAVSDAVAYELVERDGAPVLRVRVDRGWLDDPSRVYPVVVDPTHTTSPYLYEDTYVREGSTADFSGLSTLRTGRNSFSTNRTFMQFGLGDRGGLIPMDGYHTLNWAQIHLYNFSSEVCSPALSSRYVHIKRVTSWWLHQNPVWPGPVYDDYSWASSDKALGASSSCPAGWVSFNVTALARAWNDNTYPNYGVTVVASTSFTDTYRAYYSQEYSNTTLRPYMAINWNNAAPATPTPQQPTDGAILTATRPRLTASFADPDGDWGWNRFTLQRQDGASWVTVIDDTRGPVTECCQAYIDPPTLQEGVYRWRVRSDDAFNLSAWSAYVTFTVDPTAPAAPAVASSTHPSQSSWYASDAPSFSWTASDTSGINGYSWVLDQSPTTTPNTTSQGTATTTSYSNLVEGEHWFHVRARNGAGLWGPAAHYRVHIVPDCPGFVSKWSPRLYDVEFVDDLRAQDGYPQYILDEGYHALTEPVQRQLVDCLVDALTNEQPLPDGTTADQLQQVRDRLYLLIFDKDNLPPAGWENVSDVAPDVGEPGSVVPQDVRDALANLASPAIPPGSASPPRPLPELLADIADPNALLEAQGLPGDLGVPVDVTGNLERLMTATQLRPLVDSAVDAIQDAALLDVPGLSTVTDPLGTLLDATTYRLCWASATSTGCSPSTLLGVPVAVDVTGEGTFDVLGGLSPAVEATFPLGAAVTYTLERLSTSETDGGPLQAHVWATYEVVASDTRMRVGFDGWARGETLSDATRLTFTANSLTELLEGRLDADYSLAHSGTRGPSWALSAARTSVGVAGAESDPSAVSLGFTGVPDTVTGDVVASQPDGDGQRHVAFRAAASSQPQVVDAVFQRDRDATGERDQARLVVHESPTSVAVTYTRTEGAEGSRSDVDYAADTPTGRLQAAWVHRPDSDQHDTYSSSFADLRDLPATVTASVDQQESLTRVSAEGATAWGATRVGYSDIADGQRVHSVAVATDGVPDTVDLAFDTSDGDLRAGYAASAGIGVLHAAVVNRRGVPLTLLAHATGLPAALTVHADAAEASLALDAAAPITELTVQAAVRDGAVPARGGGDAVAVRTDAGTVGLNTHLSGVQTLKGHLGGDRADITGRFWPGGQPLTVALLDVGKLLAVGAVSALPAEVNLSVLTDPVHPQVAYEASAPVPLVQAYLSDLVGGHTVLAAAEDVPAAVSAVATIGDPLLVAYTATAPTGPVSIAYSPDHITRLDPDTDQRYVVAVADALPAQASLRVATDDGFALDWTADAAIGHLAAAVRGLGPLATTDARLVASATDVPTTLSATLNTTTRTLAFAAGTPVGEVFVAARNRPGGRLPGPHLKAIIDQPTGTYDVSGHLTGLHAATVTASPDQSLALDLHADLAGAPLALLADVTLEADRVIRAVGLLDDFPTDLTVRYDLNDQILYDAAGTNMTVFMAGEAGWQAALDTIPALPFYNGVAVRDGACQPGAVGCGPNEQASLCTQPRCSGVKATIAASLPHHVAVTPATKRLGIRGHHPALDGQPLVAYADIDHLVSPGFEAHAALDSPAGPLDVTIDNLDFTKAGPTGEQPMRLRGSLTANRPVGDLALRGTAKNANGGADVRGELHASDIGRTLEVDAAIGSTTDIQLRSEAAAGTALSLHAETTRDGRNVAASARLADLPGRADLAFATPGQSQGIGVPLLTYDADADTLDGDIAVDAALAGTIESITVGSGAFQAGFTNLGRRVTSDYMERDGVTSLEYRSEPATGRLWAVGNALINTGGERNFGLFNEEFGPFTAQLTFDVDLDLKLDTLEFDAHDIEGLAIDVRLPPAFGVVGEFDRVALRMDHAELKIEKLGLTGRVYSGPEWLNWDGWALSAHISKRVYNAIAMQHMVHEPGRFLTVDQPWCGGILFRPRIVDMAAAGDRLIVPGDGARHTVWLNPVNNDGKALFPDRASRVAVGYWLGPYNQDRLDRGFSLGACPDA